MLLIDVQVQSGDPTVSVLTLYGFDVECATTGAEGVRKAVTKPYAGIILDLRLPDISGLAVLKQLATEVIDTPVLVLTGYADVDSAVTAIKLGAIDYKPKPLMGDDLIGAVRSLISAGPPNRVSNRLNRHKRRRYCVPTLDETAHRLATPSIGALEFVLLAQSLRRLNGDPTREPLHETRRRSWTAEEREAGTVLLKRLAEALSRGALPSLDSVAQEASVPTDHIDHLLKALTNWDFRQCRRALRVRPTVPEVAMSHEQIAQIAYKHGYEWPGQLDRDFKATLRLTPTAFRRLFVTKLLLTALLFLSAAT